MYSNLKDTRSQGYPVSKIPGWDTFHYTSTLFVFKWSVDNINLFILHWVYLSRQIALTGYVFVIYCHWLKYSLFWYHSHMLPVELCDHICVSSSFPVDWKYQKRQSRDNFINYSKSKFLLRWINATFLKGKYNSNAVS